MQSSKIENESLYFKNTFWEGFKLYIPVFNPVLAPSRLVYQVWARYKDEVLMWSTSSNQNIETCKNKLKLTKRKALCSKKYVNVHKSSSKTSNFQFLLSILNAFTAVTKEYYPECYKIINAKGLQVLSHDCSMILRLEVANHKYWLI